MIRLLTILTFMLISNLVSAQGWERIVSGGAGDEGRSLAQTLDGGYVIAGPYSGIRSAIVKTDADGLVQWSKTYSSGASASQLNSIIMLPDSNFVAAGFFKPNGLFSQSNGYVLKVDPYGNVLWQKNFGGSNDETLNEIAVLADGSFVAIGSKIQSNGMEDAWMVRLDVAGNVLSEKTYGTTQRSETFNALSFLTNGDLVLCGISKEGPDHDVYVVRVNPQGDAVWEQTYGFDFIVTSPSSDDGNAIATDTDGGLVIAGRSTSAQGQNSGLLLKISSAGDPTPIWFRTFPSSFFNGIASDREGGYVLCGLKESSTTVEDMYLVHTNATGDEIWENTVGKLGPDAGNEILVAPDGGVVIAGTSYANNFLQGDSYFYLVKTTAEGIVYSNYIQGNIFHDFNENCSKDTPEPGLEDWIVKVSNAQLGTQYIMTDPNGNFQFLVDTGSYSLTVFTPNDYWKSCEATYTVAFNGFYDTTIVNLPIKALNSCPRNEIDVATSLLRHCADNIYTVRYCNSGTIPSINTKIKVEIDTFLSLTSSSIPWESVAGRVYTFNIGYLNNQDCGSFTINAFLDCNAAEVGQTHCVNAHIYPDSFCVTPADWNGAIIEAKGKCEHDSVILSVKNRGNSPLNTTLEYIIAEDILMRVAPGDPTATFNGLNPDEERIVWATPANGKTYRIIAEQAPGYPGMSIPTAAVEGCKTDSTSAHISTGYYTMFPEDDADAFVSINCQESQDNQNIPSFVKRGHPKGFDADYNYISPTTDMDYLIRFANTSTHDTIQQVIVRDTLSAWLDPVTVYPGASTHAYNFQVYGGGIVQFTLQNLNLMPAGSSAGDEASSGYVKFRVSQKPDTSCGRTILNRAAIYYDYNAPAFSNQTFHTICNVTDKITLKSKEINLVGADVKVFPNPFDESTIFEVQGVRANSFSLELYDVLGRRVYNQHFNQPTFRLFRHQLAEGLLFYRLSADGRLVAAGKIEVSSL